MAVDREYADLALMRRLLRLAKGYRAHIAALYLVSLVATPIALLTPLPLKIAVDSGLQAQPLPAIVRAFLPQGIELSQGDVLLFAAALVVAVALLAQLQDLLRSLLRAYTGERLVLAFRAQLFRHVQRLSLSYHDTRGTSESLYRIQYDAISIQNIAIDGVIPFLSACVTFATMLFIMLRLDWQLALVGLGVSPVHYVVARVYRRRLRVRSREVKRLEAAALADVQETLGALRVVKAFGQEDQHETRFVHRSTDGMRARIGLTYSQSRLALLTKLASAAGTATVLLVGAMHVRAGTLSLGDLLLLMGYLAQLYGPVNTIGSKAAAMQSHLASAERALALLDEESDVREAAEPRPLARAAGEVTFEDVSFAYDDRAVLRDISFDIHAGERVGIVGATGAGKTTLVNLLSRFYDPTAGRILLDGIDLRDYRLTDLRSQFAIVLQDPLLFSVSIGENIAYARPDADRDEIIAAARAANAHEFISALPQGYDTLVGERGMRLSGGERQRISLARAFLKDAPILVLDEPTSAVDTQTEAAILDAMERLVRGRTTFVITHRQATLRDCDVLLQLARGRLLTVGRPAVGLQAAVAGERVP